MPVPGPAGDSPWQWHRLGVYVTGSSPVGKVLVVSEVDRRQPCALAAREATSILGCVTRSVTRRSRTGFCEILHPDFRYSR